jgi:hypothetical protein
MIRRNLITNAKLDKSRYVREPDGYVKVKHVIDETK